MSMMRDLECDLMTYCLKQKGKWWANHFFRNQEVSDLYATLRALDAGTVMCITQGDEDYQKHIDLYEDSVKPIISI